MHKMEAEEKEVALQFAREYFNSGQSTYRDSCVTTPNIYLSFIMHSAKKVRIPPLAISLSSQPPVSNSNGCAFLMRLEWKEDQNHEKIHHISASPAQFSTQTMRRQNGRIAPEATKWLLHAEEKLQRLLSAHKTVCLLSKFLHHINHPISTTIPKLARARAGQFKIFERCRKKQIQRSASLQGFMKVLSMMPSTCQWTQVLSLHPWLQGHSLLHKLLPNAASTHDPHKVNQNHVNKHLYPTRYTWCQWKKKIFTMVLYKWQQKLRHFGSASWYRAQFRSLQWWSIWVLTQFDCGDRIYYLPAQDLHHSHHACPAHDT